MNQRELFLRHVAQTSPAPMMGIDIDIVSAEGSTLTDRSGKQYTDLISGISVSSVGHCHPRVVEAIKRQAGRFMHLMVYGEFNQSPQVRYAQLLCSLLPAPLDNVFFTTGGSEAVDGAVKLAKRFTGRAGIVYFDKAYHGSMQGPLSLMGDETLKQPFRPLIPGTRMLRYNNPDDLAEITSQTAAVIIEPVQGEAGVRRADKKYMQALRERCTETGALLILDEIQTGFGRTGELFAFSRYHIVPDILVIAKGMGGGLPVGAFIASRDVMSVLSKEPALGHINTFGGNAVCVAAAQAALEVVLDERLVQRAADIEATIRSGISHPAVKEVRCCGALAAVEFGDEALNMRVIRKCLEMGVITDWFLFCPTALRITPPLNIGDEALAGALQKLNAAIQSES